MAAGHEHTTSNARLIAIALALTGTFLVAEVVGGILTGSLALISDASHMFTDTVGLAIALAAIRIGQRPADTRRTFGYQRFEILAAAANAILLFGVAAYILWEGYQRLIRPQEIQSLAMLGVATLGLIVNIIAMRLLSDRKDASLNVKGAYLEVWSDMLGSIGVIIGALVIRFTGWTVADPIIAVLIGLWVLPRTWTLLRQAGHVLMQGVPEGIELDSVRSLLLQHPAVAQIHDLHAWSLGSRQTVVTAHIVLREGKDDPEEVRLSLLTALEDRFNVHDATLQVERKACEDGHAHA